jgi:pilus assembly protein CpaB
MGAKSFIMIGVALVCAALSILSGKTWLDRQASARLQQIDQMNTRAAPAPIVTETIVIAAKPLKFGMPLTRDMLRELPWPAGQRPHGSFARIDEVLPKDMKRTVLAAMAENEMVLAPKLTGPGQRAGLAALLEDGMKAVTLKAADAKGVAGFVLPGDRVDVLLTRHQTPETAHTDILLQNVRVLAVDQSADQTTSTPAVFRLVTLEVAAQHAQMVALAESIGDVSLILRRAGDAHTDETRRLSVSELSRLIGAVSAPDSTASFAPAKRNSAIISVTRGAERKDYTVPGQAHP